MSKNTILRPLHNRIVAKRAVSTNITAGGIIIPDTIKEKPQEAVVISTGPGIRDKTGKIKSTGVVEGDRILYGRGAGTEVIMNNETFLILNDKEVLAIVK